MMPKPGLHLARSLAGARSFAGSSCSISQRIAIAPSHLLNRH